MPQNGVQKLKPGMLPVPPGLNFDGLSLDQLFQACRAYADEIGEEIIEADPNNPPIKATPWAMPASIPPRTPEQQAQYEAQLAEPNGFEPEVGAAIFSACAAPPAPPANDNEPGGKKVQLGIDAESLLAMDFPPVRYVVPGYIAEGLTILGGRPKLGKSWMALNFAMAVAGGSHALGTVECEQGDALYLALEDNDRRLRDRIRTLLPKLVERPDLSRLTLATEAPRMDRGLMDSLDAWRASVSDPRLIIIDTHQMIRPPKKGNQGIYESDYAAVSPLQRYASEHGLAIVLVTHVRKSEADDPLEMVSGSNGLTGAADTILVLNRDASGPKLYGRGRDLDEIEKALAFDAGRWSIIGDADEVQRSTERKKIIEALEEAGRALGPQEIADETGMKATNVKYLLRKMVEAGEAEKVGHGLYRPPSLPSPS